MKREQSVDITKGEKQMLAGFEVEKKYMKDLSNQNFSEYLPAGGSILDYLDPIIRDLNVTDKRMVLTTQCMKQSSLATQTDSPVF